MLRAFSRFFALTLFIVSVTSSAAALNAPANVTAQPVLTREILISWSDTNGGTAKYVIERSSTSDFRKVKKLKPKSGALTFLDKKLQVDTVYFYRMQATKKRATPSEYSPVISVRTGATTAPNTPPSASAGSNQSGGVGEPLNFSGAASFDSDGTITSYQWAFGDGTSASGMNVSHAFSAPGNYPVTLTVTDNRGGTDTDTLQAAITQGGGTAGSRRWSRKMGASSFVDNVTVLGVAAAPNGDVVTVGKFTHKANFGNGDRRSNNDTLDAFVAVFDRDGRPRWDVQFGGLNWDFGEAVAVAPNGDILVAVTFFGTVDFREPGKGPVTPVGNSDGAIVSLSGANGATKWVRTFGGAGADTVRAIAVTAGGVVVGGHFKDASGTFGGATLPWSGGGEQDAFAARYSLDGTPQWGKRFATGSAYTNTLAADTLGNIVVAGKRANNVYVAKLKGTDGATEWLKSYTLGEAAGVSIEPATNDIVLGGSFGATINFGGGNLGPAKNTDGFVTRLTSDGEHVWSKHYFGGPSTLANYDELITGVAVDNSGNIVVQGRTLDELIFDGGRLPIMNYGYDPFLHKLSSSGGHVWSKRLPSLDGSYTFPTGVAIAADNAIIAAGSFYGRLSIDGVVHDAQLPSQSLDGYVAAFEP